ncbi:hypothetical protein [Hymenobacter chitinivorans]|uniref:Uncharacterized protein n=1 Tax=Hymenobacter chitinivorans DSM 11115 TaxID=1121954 RepID=A0A2M9BA34_9BACT|nr:hypothetical protein [Hymenobacter chitinivorans]PJJ54803.1 hypothetical protein CLV45_3149 [Hymenobacter chitinivorans DSM 11115]
MNFSLSDTWITHLPADIYEQLAHCLSLHGMVCAELFSRPDSALVQQLMLLTPVTAATVAALNGVQSQEQLIAALRQEPGHVYDLLLLGRLSLDTSLAEPVLRFVRQQMYVSEEQLVAIKVYCVELSEAFLASVEQHLAETDRAVAGRLGQHRLQIEEAFYTHSQSVSEEAEPLPSVANVRFNDPQLQMVRLAVLLVHSLPTDSEVAFVQAVAQIPALQPHNLEALTERLGALQAGEQITLSMPELVQIYQAMQVCGLVFVSDVMVQLGLEDFMSGPPEALEPTAEADAPARGPMSSRQAVGEMVSGFTEWVQTNFADDPEVVQAREEIAALTDLI